jgi:hypothetical protein
MEHTELMLKLGEAPLDECAVPVEEFEIVLHIVIDYFTSSLDSILRRGIYIHVKVDLVLSSQMFCLVYQGIMGKINFDPSFESFVLGGFGSAFRTISLCSIPGQNDAVVFDIFSNPYPNRTNLLSFPISFR